MVSGVILHSLPSGYRFDLRRRSLLAPLRPVSASERELRLVRTAGDRTRRLIRRIAAEGADDAAPERSRRRALRARRDARGGERVTRETKRAVPAAKTAAVAKPVTRNRVASRNGPALLPAPSLRIVETRVYRGPSYWSYEPAIKLLVDLGVLEEFPSNTIRGFVEGCWTCSRQSAGTAAQPARPGASRSGCETARGPVTSPSTSRCSCSAKPAPRSDGARHAAPANRAATTWCTPTPRRASGVAAGRLAVRLVNHLVEADPAFDFGADLEKLILLAEKAAFGPSTQAILDEAPCATSRPSGSTSSRWCSWATASTRSGSAPP